MSAGADGHQVASAAAGARDRSGAAWLLINGLQALYTALWSAFWITAALVVLLLTASRRAPLAMARRFWGPGLLQGAGAKLCVQGVERIDPSRPYVFVSNHQSMIDVPVVFAAIPVNVRFVLKKELQRVPFIGWYAWAMGMIFVDRARRTQALGAISRAAAVVKNGASVVTFAEGTRSRDGRTGVFKKGAFHLALAAGVPVVPLSIRGAVEVLPRDGFRVRPGTITVHIGEPVETASWDPDDLEGLVARVRREVIAHTGEDG